MGSWFLLKTTLFIPFFSFSSTHFSFLTLRSLLFSPLFFGSQSLFSLRHSYFSAFPSLIIDRRATKKNGRLCFPTPWFRPGSPPNSRLCCPGRASHQDVRAFFGLILVGLSLPSSKALYGFLTLSCPLSIVPQNSPMESMSEEREKATFDVRGLTYYLDGGEKFTKVQTIAILSFKRQRLWTRGNIRGNKIPGLTIYLFFSLTMVQVREKFMLELERDPTFRMHDMYDLTKDQIRERTMEKVRRRRKTTQSWTLNKLRSVTLRAFCSCRT